MSEIINKEEEFNCSRRNFIKAMVYSAGNFTLSGYNLKNIPIGFKNQLQTKPTAALIYRSINGSPESNMIKIIEMMGGIKNIVSSEDVVVIKPNVQWWNHGAPNLASLKTFVDVIMEMPGGFKGEVVIAENCHRGNKPWKSINSGWERKFEINSEIPDVFNLNDLTVLLKNNYGRKFSVCHWIDVGSGGKRVYGPADGNGYVFCDGTGGVPLLSLGNGAMGNQYRATILTYPIFITDRGTVIDFKNGIWEKGAYTGRDFRFINFAALNHHSRYCGVTSSMKNYMGITDLSGGPDPFTGGRLTDKYYNFHSFPFNKWSKGPVPGMLGAEIAFFMKEIRKADLNIVTAEWVGLSSRTCLPVARTKTVLASKDSVALDYHGSKYILFPNSKIKLHDPDNEKAPLYQYLHECGKLNEDATGEKDITCSSFDLSKRRYTKEGELPVKGDIHWGNDIKNISKYLALKYLY
ncbi:MAG: DUF362 domain-containing protein [Candidatus Dadabacteria bacterium]|nr:DUF362 domain-containing protein [Candidatus Dadabacteria bacterium]